MVKHIRHPERLLLVSAAALLCLGFICLFVLAILDAAGGYSIDPTDPVNFFNVDITNDSSQTVHVTWVNTCVSWDKDQCAQSWTIPPRATVQDDKEPRNSNVKYTVNDQSGHLLGCLNVTRVQSQTHGTIALDISHETKCN